MTAGRSRPKPWKIALAAACVLLVLAAIDLGVQEVYHRYVRPAASPRPVASPSVPLPTRPLPPPAPTSLPSPTLVPSDSGIPWEQALQRILFQQMLLKASQELLRAEGYVASGDLKQAERELIAVGATLEQASRYADESLAGPVQDLLRDLSRLREELYLRPERLREGMLRLWQRIDTLIGP